MADCILVIDDDEQMLRMLKLALTRAGMDVLTASDGSIALNIFKKQHPDLALVDIAMPGMDGYDVIQQMREIEEGGDEHAAIIILTAHTQPVMRTYAADLGVDLYLTKPVTPADLVDHIHAILDGHRN